MPTLTAMHMLLVEDDPTIARELALRWRQRGWSVQWAATLAEASRAKPEEGRYDVVLLDLGLPDGDGLQWLTQWRELDRVTPVLMLTARDRVVDRVLGLKSGADDYLVKPFSPDELDARVEVLVRRAQLGRGERAQVGRVRWMRDEGRAYVDDRPLELTPREFEVLGLLLRRAPRLVAKRALIDALSERNEEVLDSAAELYVSRLRRKLEGSGVVIRTLRGFGYVLSAADGECEPPA